MQSVEALTSEYREALDLLKTRLPVADQVLQTELKALKSHMKQRYRDEALGDESMREQYWVELKETIAVDNAKLWDSNIQAADAKYLKPIQAQLQVDGKIPSQLIADLEKDLADDALPNRVCHVCCNKVKLSPWKGSMIHANVP